MFSEFIYKQSSGLSAVFSANPGKKQIKERDFTGWFTPGWVHHAVTANTAPCAV